MAGSPNPWFILSECDDLLASLSRIAGAS